MNRLEHIIGTRKLGGDIMTSRKERIAKEQKLKVDHIAELNKWLEKKGYDYEVINYSACGFTGSEKDNRKLVQTVKFMADGFQEYATENL